jgi:hypothetical protein
VANGGNPIRYLLFLLTQAVLPHTYPARPNLPYNGGWWTAGSGNAGGLDEGVPAGDFEKQLSCWGRHRWITPTPFKKSKTTFEALCNILRALEKIGPAHERTA